MRLLARLGVVLSFLEGVSCLCPSQCTCDYHGRNDGTGSRYATKCSNDSEERDPPSALFESKLLIRNQRREGLIYISFNLVVLILVANAMLLS